MADSIVLICYGIMAVVVFEGMRERIPSQRLRFWVAVFWTITMPIFLIMIMVGISDIEE